MVEQIDNKAIQSQDAASEELQISDETQQETELTDEERTELTNQLVREFLDAFFPLLAMLKGTRTAHKYKLDTQGKFLLFLTIFFLWGAALCELMIDLEQVLLYRIIMILTVVAYIVVPLDAFKQYKKYIADTAKEEFPVTDIASPLRVFFKYVYLFYFYYAMVLFVSFQASGIAYVIMSGALLAFCLFGDIVLHMAAIRKIRKHTQKASPALLSTWKNSIKGITILYLIGIAFYIWRILRI